MKLRLRRRIDITEPFYLKEAIDSLSTSPQTSLNLLLHGLQHETDPIKKSRAANYFQRLLKWIDEQDWKGSGNRRITLGLLDNLSKTDLMISSAPSSSPASSSINNAIGTVPPTLLSNLKITNDDMNSDSDDSLLYCPVCSHRFTRDRESHLTSCLSTTKPKSIGTRYTSTESNGGEECPICYEDLGGQVAVMDCLCKFHEKCIEEWFKRGKQCPFHCE